VTLTIPDWLLYVLYGIGGLLALAILFVICALAFVGWWFVKTWRPPNW